jgi:hypothetical protein
LVNSDNRKIFKFYLKAVEYITKKKQIELSHSRLIPTAVKLEVWAKDKGQCILFGSSVSAWPSQDGKENLHFDHDLPYSKGGTSLTAENLPCQQAGVRILCMKHNQPSINLRRAGLQKLDKILSLPQIFLA